MYVPSLRERQHARLSLEALPGFAEFGVNEFGGLGLGETEEIW